MSNKGSFNRNSFNQETSSQSKRKQEEFASQEEVKAEQQAKAAHTEETKAEQAETQTETPEVEAEVVTEEAPAVEEKVETEEEKQAKKLAEFEKLLTLDADLGNYEDVKGYCLKLTAKIQEQAFPAEYAAIFLRKLKDFTNTINQKVCVFLESNSDDLVSRVENYHQTNEELTKQLERAKREKESAKTYANEKLISGPLKNFVETLQLSITSSSKVDSDTFRAFIEEMKKFDGNLRKNLEKFDIYIYGKAGDKFDPHLHEAISQFQAPTEEQAGTIAFVSSEGFKLHDRIIEPAKVVVFTE